MLVEHVEFVRLSNLGRSALGVQVGLKSKKEVLSPDENLSAVNVLTICLLPGLGFLVKTASLGGMLVCV